MKQDFMIIKLENMASMFKRGLLAISKQINDLNLIKRNELISLNGFMESLNQLAYEMKLLNSELENKIYSYIAENNSAVKKSLQNKVGFYYNQLLIQKGKPAKAIRNLEKLAKRGDVKSQLLIGTVFLYGVIGKNNEIKMKDIGLALKWLAIAYKRGNSDAGYLIGLFEKSSLNTKSAINIFTKLSKKGHIKAIKELHLIYRSDFKYANKEKALSLFNAIKKQQY